MTTARSNSASKKKTESKQTSPTAKSASEAVSVLLVDDEAEVLDVMQQVLELKGFDVATAGTFTAAVAAGTASSPAVLVTDFLLPDGNGIELIDLLRVRSPDLPAVLVSGNIEDDDEIQAAIDSGRVEYLRKPFTMSRLYSAIDRVLKSASDLVNPEG